MSDLLAARRGAVEILGRSLLDYLPDARGSFSGVDAPPGLRAGDDAPCTACASRGRLGASGRPCSHCPPRIGPRQSAAPFDTGHGCVPCLVCEGTGWRRRRGGEPAYDSYTGDVLPPKEKPAVGSLKELEARLAHTEMQIAQWEAPESVEVGWERRRVAQWRQGSYRELVRALRWLEGVAPRRYATWWRIVVAHEQVTVAEGMRRELEVTSEMLAERMPSTIRVPPHLREEARNEARKAMLWRGRMPAHERARAERNLLIAEMRAGAYDGQPWKVHRIARHFALTERQVKKILATASQGAAA